MTEIKSSYTAENKIAMTAIATIISIRLNPLFPAGNLKLLLHLCLILEFKIILISILWTATKNTSVQLLKKRKILQLTLKKSIK